MLKALRRRRRNDGGAVAVESAVVSLFLVTLVFGVLEFGLVISQSLAVSSSVRAGARVAATAGTAADSDYQVLQALRNAQGFMSLADVNVVVIYKDTDANQSALNSQCKKGIAVAGVCNVYTKNDFNLTAQQLFESGKNSYWPSSSRIQFVDYAGVYMGIEHQWLTNLFGAGGRQLADVTVMQIQPQATKPWMPTTTTAPPTTTTTIVSATTSPPVATTTAPTTTTTTSSGTGGGSGGGNGSGNGTGNGNGNGNGGSGGTGGGGSGGGGGNCTSTYCPTTTTARPTTTTAKPTTTTAKPTTTTTMKPTTTTTKPPAIPSF